MDKTPLHDSPHECLTNKALMSFTFYVIPLLCRVNALSGIHDLPAYLSTSLLEPLHRPYSIFALSTNVLYIIEYRLHSQRINSGPCLALRTIGSNHGSPLQHG